MWLSLMGTAFFMGLVGGPHCLAMCAAPCAVITSPLGETRIEVLSDPSKKRRSNTKQFFSKRLLTFHIGRLLGYSVLGGVAAYAMERIAWFSDRTAALHPVWVGLHLLAFAWGLMLLFQARQPKWLEQGGRTLWQTVQTRLNFSSGSLIAGCLWAFLPCGLLYSAVLVAALGGGVAQGGGAMLAFGVGTGLWLIAAPWFWLRIRQLPYWRESWGLRLAGAMLALISLWALWIDVIQQPMQWCR